MNPEIRMSSQDVKRVRNQLIMVSVFLLMFVPLLISFIGAIPLMRQTPENLVFAAGATCFIAMLAIVSGWYWILFAIHVRSARFQNGEIDIERLFAPTVKISSGHALKQKAIPTPSLRAPNYQRGILFIAGMSSFYVPDNFPDASMFIDFLSSRRASL